MDLMFNETEELFRKATEGALARAADAGEAELWSLAASMDWLDLAAGGDPDEVMLLAILAECLGAAGVRHPIVPVLAAGQALRLAGVERPADAGRVALVDGAGPGTVVELPTGTDRLLVLCHGDTESTMRWVRLDGPGVEVEPVAVMDGTPSAVVRSDAWASEVAWTGPPAVARAASDLGKLLRSLLLIGAATTMHGLAVDHITSREQFGRPIGSFQAARHLAVDAWTQLVAARLAAYEAVGELAHGRTDGRSAAVATFAAGEAAERASHAASQLHGGIGFMVEHRLPGYFTFVKSHRVRLGTAAALLDRIAAVTIDGVAAGRRLRMWDEVS